MDNNVYYVANVLNNIMLSTGFFKYSVEFENKRCMSKKVIDLDIVSDKIIQPKIIFWLLERCIIHTIGYEDEKVVFSFVSEKDAEEFKARWN